MCLQGNKIHVSNNCVSPVTNGYVAYVISSFQGRTNKPAINKWIRLLSRKWAQVEWWLEHRYGWLVERQWAESVLGRVTRDEYHELGSTPLVTDFVTDTLVYWYSFWWLTSVGTTRNTVISLGWSRIGLVVPMLYATGAGLIGRPAVISGRYNECHPLQLQNHYTHFPLLQHTHIYAKHNEALHADCGRKNPVWSGKESHWSLRGLIVKSAEHCGADYKPLDRDR